ncbi:MAG: tRNA pseudouridine(38-40) synthase TruA [Chitinispirillia bacterium]|nr:tRNA pseudouridine(38-40) synthase TruA [Chitinispirillia bacterium]MCL2267582.1 tRNA pseudouridine(38-40) synthase TruA [Chitinispirillia bacterium]
MRYFFRVEYDGTRFGGWQYQPNAISVQQLIDEALTVILRTPCGVTGAGRTDAGVHARGQGAHFDAPEEIDTERLTTSLNALLPYDIAVYGMTAVNPGFHARYSASSRMYKYYFADRKSPLSHKRAWAVYYPIDWNRVDNEIKCLSGPRDFTAFCSSGTDSKSMVCDISFADVSVHDNGARIFTIRANRFIYKMVRSLVGTLVDIGRGRLSDSLDLIINSKDRNKAGETAPACGLVLEWVDYGGADACPISKRLGSEAGR